MRLLLLYHSEMKCVLCIGDATSNIYAQNLLRPHTATNMLITPTYRTHSTWSSTRRPLQFSVKGLQCCPVPPDPLSVSPSGSGAWQRGDKALRLQCTLAYIAEQYAGWTTEQLAQDHGDGSSLGAIQEGE